MKNIKKLSFLPLLLFVMLLTACIIKIPKADNQTNQNTTQTTKTEQIKHAESQVIAPVKEFEQRITKKPFGIFITPQTSPVQPERFSGFHTGVDVEFDDVKEDVEVLAISDGVVEHSGWVTGYGGVVAISHIINNDNYLAIYGHLNSESLIVKDQEVKKGQQIGILGQAKTTQTDGERKHLHLAIYKGKDLNLKGYVKNKEELLLWINPETLINSKE